MSSQKGLLTPMQLHASLAFSLIVGISVMFATQLIGFAKSQQDELRTIVSDDFIKNRPKSQVTGKSSGKSGGPSSGTTSRRRRTYKLATSLSTRPQSNSSLPVKAVSQLGVTIWRLRPAGVAGSNARTSASERGEWIAERVEADTRFHEGDYLRISIESPVPGYLYVIDRDWFTNGSYGDTNLIFPVRGDDNRLHAGRLMDIPAEDQSPFRTSPKPDQAGEILTILVTSTPLELPLSSNPLPISRTQLAEWELKWASATTRFEMEGGAGEARTRHEKEASARKGTRQLTRDDPGPQTIYLVTPRNNDAFLFNLTLSYVR